MGISLKKEKPKNLISIVFKTLASILSMDYLNTSTFWKKKRDLRRSKILIGRKKREMINSTIKNQKKRKKTKTVPTQNYLVKKVVLNNFQVHKIIIRMNKIQMSLRLASKIQ